MNPGRYLLAAVVVNVGVIRAFTWAGARRSTADRVSAEVEGAGAVLVASAEQVLLFGMATAAYSLGLFRDHIGDLSGRLTLRVTDQSGPETAVVSVALGSVLVLAVPLLLRGAVEADYRLR